MVLWILFDYINVRTDNDVRRIPPKEIKENFRALENLYTSEEDASLLLSISFDTCSRLLRNCLTFTQESFLETLVLLPERTKLSRQIIKQYKDGGKEFIDVSLSGDTLKYAFNRYIPAQPKFLIEISKDTDSKLETYGYLPSIRIDELGDSGEGEFQDIFSRIGLVGYLDSTWRISAYVYYRHRVSSEAELIKAIKSKLFDSNDLVEIAKRPVYDYSISLEYRPENGVDTSVIEDIEDAILHVIRNGWKKESAIDRLRIYDQEIQKPRMWGYLKPLWERFDRRKAMRFAHLERSKKLLFSHMTSNPVAINKAKVFEIYANLSINPMYVSRKLDGQRAIIVLDIQIDQNTLKRNKTIFGNAQFLTFTPIHTGEYNINITSADLTAFKKNKIGISGFANIVTIFDSEYYKGAYYIFDVLSFINDKCVVEHYDKRLERLQRPAFAYMQKMAKRAGLTLATKAAALLTKQNFKAEMLKLFETEHKGINYDGVILTTNAAPAFQYATFKVKPPKHNTVDFLLKRIDQQYLLAYGIRPVEDKICYVAYVSYQKRSALRGVRPLIRSNPWFSEHFPKILSVRPEDRMPVPFATAICPTSHLLWWSDDYDDTIVECTWRDDHWEPFIVRTDKTAEYKSGLGMYGNHYQVAFDTFITNLDKLTKDDLENVETAMKPYFRYVPATITRQYQDFLMFNRVGKAIVYEKYIKPNLDRTIIEIAAGRFSDFDRMYFAGARNMYILDADLPALLDAEKRAIDEMLTGKKNVLANLISGVTGEMKETINLLSILLHFGADETAATNAADQILADEHFPKSLANVASMQFAVHYLCGSEKTFDGLKAFLKKLLRKGGIFVTTFYDGNAILSMFRSKSKVDNVYSSDGKVIKFFHGMASDNSGDVKYRIEALFDPSKVERIKPGLKVRILIPTISDEPYVENLTSADLIGELLGADYAIQSSEKFIDLTEVAEQYLRLRGRPSSNAMALKRLLSDEDVAYVSLIRFAVFRYGQKRRWRA